MNRAFNFLRALAVAMIGAVVSLHSTNAAAGALGTLAASMQPGSFAELTPMTGWSSGSILVPLDAGCTTSDYITSFADKAGWDPVNDRVVFIGATHGNCYASRFVIYAEGSNTWSQGPWPSSLCQSGTPTSPCFNHGFDHNAVDPATGDFYYRNYNSLTFLRYRNGAWTTLPSPPIQDHQCCGGLEYFPDMKKLIFVDGDWGVWAFDPAANSWKQLSNTNVANATAGMQNLPMSSTAVFAEYNPVLKVMLFGGGSNIYKMTSSGAITALKTPPVTMGVTNAITSVDPVGGKYLVLSGGSMYQYDIAADAWTQLSIAVPPVLTAMMGVGDGLVAADVTTYGVVMYIKYDFTSSKVYLYKHSPTPAGQPAPSPSIKPDPPSAVIVQ